MEAGSEALAAGERVEVSIRPEDIRLAAPPARLPGALATVTRHVFLGNLSEYLVALRAGPVLRVQSHPRQRLDVGATVAVEIDGSQCSAFPAPEASDGARARLPARG